MMTTTVEDRAILLLSFVSESLDSKHGFWTDLGKASGIETARWRKIFNRRQRITSDMLEALSHQYPHYAFWLVTGITDAENGHVAPMNAQTFPERTSTNYNSAYKYFMTSIALLKHLYLSANVNFENDEERIKASERKMLYDQWWDSPLSDNAYYIAANNDMYSHLEELRSDRELERVHTINHKPTSTDEALSNADKLGADPRTQHQNSWDLYYKPLEVKKSIASKPDDNQTS